MPVPALIGLSKPPAKPVVLINTFLDPVIIASLNAKCPF
jgi:hypothetical protein